MSRQPASVGSLSDAEAIARLLDVSTDAVELYRASEVFDLHVDSFIWRRVLRYDLRRRHRVRPFGRRFLGQVDVPRAIEQGLTGAMWSITTNPFRSAAGRQRAFDRNLPRLLADLDGAEGVDVVRTVAEFRTARAAGRHGAFVAIQGGHAIRDPASVADDVVRITLVHLNSSMLGETSSPTRRMTRVRGLTDAGCAFIESCVENRILVDLAHISPKGFWDAVDVHGSAFPLIVTHTGVSGVHSSWRNLDDDQLQAVGASGGCVGIMLHEQFLNGGTATVSTVADHLDHVARVAGEDAPAIGTDLDGMVVPPSDLQGYQHLPRLVHELQRRGWSDERVHKALGGNALRTIEAVRG